MVWKSDAVSAAEEHLDVAPTCQCTVDLEGNGAGSRSKVVVPESKGGCVQQCVAIVPIHVTEPADTLMPGAAVELDDQSELQVVDIAHVGEIGPRLLSPALGQAVWTLDVAQIPQLDRRFGSRTNVGEQVVE